MPANYSALDPFNFPAGPPLNPNYNSGAVAPDVVVGVSLQDGNGGHFRAATNGSDVYSMSPISVDAPRNYLSGVILKSDRGRIPASIRG